MQDRLPIDRARRLAGIMLCFFFTFSVAMIQAKGQDATSTPQTGTQQNAPAANAAPAAQPIDGAAESRVTTSKAVVPEQSPISEEELKATLVGKVLYLREGQSGDSLHFDMRGRLVEHASSAPYTLSLVEISKISMNRHRIELDGVRYGLHFEDVLPSIDPMQAADRVRITPKKKVLRILIDREEVVKEKKDKGHKNAADRGAELRASSSISSDSQDLGIASEAGKTTSVGEANRTLRSALDRIFARGLDERLMASLPDFWKLYYQAAATGTDYRPKDPLIFKQNNVDQKARLLTNFEPPSNDFAQACGVAGIAVYHVVLGADGKVGEIAAARPIGFGLDENAVASIRKASFQPAMKGGHPVPVELDVIVQFRIYSKRTLAASPGDQGKVEAAISLPGPYSASHP